MKWPPKTAAEVYAIGEDHQPQLPKSMTASSRRRLPATYAFQRIVDVLKVYGFDLEMTSVDNAMDIKHDVCTVLCTFAEDHKYAQHCKEKENKR